MQYGLIGNMLLKRGAHDEAAQVFQKALELSPDDVEIAEEPRALAARAEEHRRRDGRAQGRAAHGGEPRALRRGAARDGAARRGRPDGGAGARARRRRRGAAAVPVAGCASRSWRSTRRVAAIAPLVRRPLSRREVRAAPPSYLEPILAADPRHVGALEKLAQVLRGRGQPRRARQGPHRARRGGREAAGPGARPSRTTGARSRPIPPTSRRPRASRASARSADRSTAAAGRPRPRPPAEPPEYQEFVIDLEDSGVGPRAAAQGAVDRVRRGGRGGAAPAPAAAPAPRRRAPLPAPAAPRRSRGARRDEQQIETLIVEAEVFAKYGLDGQGDRAALLAGAPAPRPAQGARAARRAARRIEEPGARPRGRSRWPRPTARPARPGDAGRDPRAGRTRAGRADGGRLPRRPRRRRRRPRWRSSSRSSTSGPAAPPPSRRPPRRLRPRTRSSSARPSRARRPAFQRLSTPEPLAPADTEFVSYEQLGDLLEDEMQKGGRRARAAPPAEAPAVDEENLFADEQKFFNLAEELEKELGDEVRGRRVCRDLDAAGRGVARGDLPRVQEGRRAAALGRGLRDALQPRDRLQGDGPRRRGDRRVPAREQGRRAAPSSAAACSATASSRRACRSSRSSGSARDSRRPAIAGRGDRRHALRPRDGLPGHGRHGPRPTRRSRRSSALNANYRDVVQRVKDLEAVRKNS